MHGSAALRVHPLNVETELIRRGRRGWNNDTCAGKYLKMLYKQRIKKNDNVREPDDVGLYTASYGGQFHFDVYGLGKRKIIGLSGFAGQQILIDIDAKRIVVVNSLYKNYDWKKIVYDQIRN